MKKPLFHEPVYALPICSLPQDSAEWLKIYPDQSHQRMVERQERLRVAWLHGAGLHPHGKSGEEKDLIPSILDQGRHLPHQNFEYGVEYWE